MALELEEPSSVRQQKLAFSDPYKDQMLTALDLFHFVESSLNGINAEFLTCADWQTEDDLLHERFNIAKTIGGR